MKQVKTELREKNVKISAMKPSELEDKKRNIVLSSQHASVNQERLKLNQAKAENQAYRREIDMLRKELTSSLNECKRLQASTQRYKKKAI